MQSFKVNTVPPDNVWVTVQPGVDFMRCDLSFLLLQYLL